MPCIDDRAKEAGVIGEFMVHKKSGKKINFQNEGGTPVLNLWIRKPDAINATESEEDDAQNCRETGFLGLGFD